MLFTYLSYFNIYIGGQVDPGQFKAFPAGPFNVMPFSLFGLIFLNQNKYSYCSVQLSEISISPQKMK